MDIEDGVVIVTGASEGIGEATARLLAREGAQVALAARSMEKLERITNELPRSFAQTVDLRDLGLVKE